MCPIDVWEMESQSPITFTHSSFSVQQVRGSPQVELEGGRNWRSH